MMKAIAIAVVLLGVRAAHAGPWCGDGGEFAPASGTTLPVAPTLAFALEDRYYGKSRRSIARIAGIRATIDGMPVSIKAVDVRGFDGAIRLVKIESTKRGRLDMYFGDDLRATYSIVDGWQAPRPTASVVREVTPDGPYRQSATRAVIRVDVPAIAFVARWRRDRVDDWRVRPLPASGLGEVRLGQTMCGAVENVPLAFLERGIELELIAKLPDGRDVPIVDGLPVPFAIPPADSRARDGS
jgi:hypothetical protein